MMNIDDVKNLAKSAAKLRCTEALLVTGESPEQKYDEAQNGLEKMDFHPLVNIWLIVLN